MDAGTSATILSNVHTMYLFEDFCVDGVDELRTSLPLAVANSFHGDAAEVMCARASIMIHELIHYVSYIRKIEFREITGCRRAQRLIDARPPLEVAIRDCKAVEFLFKRSASDRYIVAWFKETRRAGRRKKTMHGAAYGLFAVEKLAKLEDGACASLLNADSYVAYVVMSRVELLRKAYANGPLPDLAVLV